MAEPKLTYGLDENGALIRVDDAIRGKECNCVCPKCGAKLVAKQGSNNKWHFSHYKAKDCQDGRMTALHKLAQQIIQEEKKIRTPRYEDSYLTEESIIITFNKILVEEQVVTSEINRRPDCIGISDDHDIWIEIKVTHEVDKIKQRDIQKENITCLEVDLSDLIDQDYTRELVYERLFDENRYRYYKWINNPELQRKSQEARQKKLEKEASERESSRRIQEYIDTKHQEEKALKDSQKMKEKPQDDFVVGNKDESIFYRKSGKSDLDYIEKLCLDIADKFEPIPEE